MSVSNCKCNWVLRAIRAEKSVGSAMASSKELVCKLCVPPIVAAMASIAVRVTLLYGSCSVNDQPDVWLWVRKAMDFGCFAPNAFKCFDHRKRAARIFAISMKGFIPIPQKKLSRGAKASMSKPASLPVFTYSKPSHKVYAISISAVAPASCMW